MRTSQGGWSTVAQAWVQTVQRMIAESPAGILGAFNTNRAVDAWFDLAASMLAVNREYAKSITRFLTSLPPASTKRSE